MANVTPQPAPFWPQTPIWGTWILAGLCAPSLVVGLYILVDVIGAGLVAAGMSFFGDSNMAPMLYLCAIPGLGIVVGGPVGFGVWRSGSLKRGISAGCLCLPATLGTAFAYTTIVAKFDLDRYPIVTSAAAVIGFLALLAGIQIAVLEVISGDLRIRASWIGLGIGILAGFLLATVLTLTNSQPGPVKLFWISTMNSILVWVSAATMVDFFSHRVSWGGVLVWAGFVLVVLGVAMGLNAL